MRNIRVPRCRKPQIHCLFLSILSGIAFATLLQLDPAPCAAQGAPGVLQSAARTANVTGSVVDPAAKPVAGAIVQLSGALILSTRTDEHGLFYFISVPYGTYEIDVNATTLGILSRKIDLSGDISVAIQYTGQRSSSALKEIGHVSTESAGANINLTAASIAAVNPTDYAFQGNTSWQGLLNEIPGVTVGGFLYGGGAYGTSDPIPYSPLMPIVLSINGALPYETSTTFDGMPLVNTSINGAEPGGGTDLSFLPMPSFSTADVVRGPGANAPSIVDSIGGSFVLHPPGPVNTRSFEWSTSNDGYGGIFSNAKLAMRFGRLSTTIIYGFNNSPGPLGTVNVIPADPYAPLTVNGRAFLGCGKSLPTGQCYEAVTNPKYYSCYCQFSAPLLYCCAPLSTAWTQHSGAIDITYNLAPSVTTEVFYAGSSSGMDQLTPEHEVQFTPGAKYDGSVRPGIYNLSQNSFGYSSEAASLLEEKITASLGKAVLRVAALQNNSYAQEKSPTPFGNGQYGVYGSGYYGSSTPGTPVTFNGTLENLTFVQSNGNENLWTNNRDLLFAYDSQVGDASSFGISYVTSYYNFPFLDYGSYAGQPYSGGLSTANSETTDEVRIRASSDVTGNLSLDASWYSAIGAYHVQNPSDPTGHTFAKFRLSLQCAPDRGRVARDARYCGPSLSWRRVCSASFKLPCKHKLPALLHNLLLYISNESESTARRVLWSRLRQ